MWTGPRIRVSKEQENVIKSAVKGASKQWQENNVRITIYIARDKSVDFTISCFIIHVMARWVYKWSESSRNTTMAIAVVTGCLHTHIQHSVVECSSLSCRRLSFFLLILLESPSFFSLTVHSHLCFKFSFSPVNQNSLCCPQVFSQSIKLKIPDKSFHSRSNCWSVSNELGRYHGETVGHTNGPNYDESSDSEWFVHRTGLRSQLTRCIWLSASASHLSSQSRESELWCLCLEEASERTSSFNVVLGSFYRHKGQNGCIQSWFRH